MANVTNEFCGNPEQFMKDNVVLIIDSMLKSAQGQMTVKVVASKPVKMGGFDAVQVEYNSMAADELERKGYVVAAIVDRRLFIIQYEAATMHYFDKDIMAVKDIIASARFRK